jgi:predicted amidophosphoribosyltransferase
MSKNIIIALKLPKGNGNKKCPDCAQEMDNGICHECGYGSEEDDDEEEED